MPLPAALAARLAKRGLVKVKERKHDESEEVFAEDYDEPSYGDPTPPQPEEPEPAEEEEDEEEEEEEDEPDELVHETLACPNKWNTHHACGTYCKDRWGIKEFEPITDMIAKRLRMLRRFPLPEHWREVGDPDSGRFYYWNTETDQVSWLCPLHPQAELAMSEEKAPELNTVALAIAKIRKDSEEDASDEEKMETEDYDGVDVEDDFEEIERELLREKKQSQRKDRRRGRAEELDPMDPASYSEAPRGSWSTGLERRGEAKTGADVTASGPLFQQRPYPSPGAILRANKEVEDKKSK